MAMDELKSCDERTLARIISTVENDDSSGQSILENLLPDYTIPVFGITGPPGAGKSTLINALITSILSREKELIKGRGIGILAVDPSSPFSQGALLGDRLRMSSHFNHPKVFIRSLATRGSLGGLSASTIEITDIMRSAAFDFIFIETVGIGQTELEIASLADLTVLVLVPESGDEVQAMKAGVMEVADVFVVNKSDRAGSEKMVQFIHSSALIAGKEKPEVLATVASTGIGSDDLLKVLLNKVANHQLKNKEAVLLEKTVRIIRQRIITDDDKKYLKSKLQQAGSHANIYKIAAEFIRTHRAGTP
jgi:LAO/AO transport system kinase